MNGKPRQFGRDRSDGFGKRGQVSLSRADAAPPPADRAGSSNLGWIGGGIAAVALMALVLSGAGSGGFLAGLLGGLLGQKLANSMAGAKSAPHAPTASQAPATSPAQSHTVQRGGFGSTASASSGSSGHGAGA